MEYINFEKSVKLFEQDEHYLKLMCLKPVDRISPRVQKKEYLEKLGVKNEHRSNLKKLCVLPKNHKGKCVSNYKSLFKTNKTTNKLLNSIVKSIYYTPGNDDYVFKNRASRLYKHVLSESDARKIRNKNIKKKCAIPLRDASTPILLAQSYLDWITFIVNIQDIGKYIYSNNETCIKILEMIHLHKSFLISYYSHRKIFNNDGYTICVVTGKVLGIENFADISRDNRIILSEDDVQLGHCLSRNDNYVTIRGCNLLPMTRRGNLLIGNGNFCENKWLIELKQIIEHHSH